MQIKRQIYMYIYIYIYVYIETAFDVKKVNCKFIYEYYSMFRTIKKNWYTSIVNVSVLCKKRYVHIYVYMRSCNLLFFGRDPMSFPGILHCQRFVALIWMRFLFGFVYCVALVLLLW